MKNLFLLFIIVCLVAGCGDKNITDINFSWKKNLKTVQEYSYQELNLTGEASEKKAEISGLVWFNSKLLLINQYPGIEEGGYGKLWFIEKEEISEAVNNSNYQLNPKLIKIFYNGYEDIINSRGSGLEAAAVDGDIIYFSVEISKIDRTEGLLLRGKFDELTNSISLDKNFKVEINHKINLNNMSEETILRSGKDIISIYEANGRNVYPDAKAHIINTETGNSRKISIENIEYRITDATEIDNNGNFWAINYLYPGNIEKLKIAPDSIMIKYGIGTTHKLNSQVERIVKMNFDGERINILDYPPVQLELLSGEKSNNWEGLVKFENKGFLMVTDYHPRTKLVFVKYNLEQE